MPWINFHGLRAVEVRTGRYYDNDQLAVVLYEDGEPYCDVSVNFPDLPLNRDEFVVKNYSENEGLLPALLNAGIIEYVGHHTPTPLGLLPVCRLTKIV